MGYYDNTDIGYRNKRMQQKVNKDILKKDLIEVIKVAITSIFITTEIILLTVGIWWVVLLTFIVAPLFLMLLNEERSDGTLGPPKILISFVWALILVIGVFTLFPSLSSLS